MKKDDFIMEVFIDTLTEAVNELVEENLDNCHTWKDFIKNIVVATIFTLDQCNLMKSIKDAKKKPATVLNLAKK